MQVFQSVLTSWSNFFETLAGVSATFAGLLFVSLSLRYHLLNAPAFASVKRLALQTFNGFLMLVVFSLIFLIPATTGAGIGIPLFIIGCFALYTSTRLFWLDRQDKNPDLIKIPRSSRVYVLSMLTYAVLLYVSVLLVQGKSEAPSIIVGLLIWNLAWSTASAWELLLGISVSDAPKE